ncbi:phage integrase N-terminal SAM-like domain-containing protein [Thermatribacter velox]|uniref:Phage integrase N-terminal SAM-like domain-containing protein n=1 Tax=Thermatribacter velox TaxID=3039681 RepID=A0ABZ2YGN9_9BACT
MASLANNLKAKKETLWNLYLEDFLLSGRVEGKKSSTLKWYKEYLTPFVKFLDQEGLNQATLRKYVNSLFERLKVDTVQLYVEIIDSKKR